MAALIHEKHVIWPFVLSLLLAYEKNNALRLSSGVGSLLILWCLSGAANPPALAEPRMTYLDNGQVGSAWISPMRSGHITGEPNDLAFALASSPTRLWSVLVSFDYRVDSRQCNVHDSRKRINHLSNNWLIPLYSISAIVPILVATPSAESEYITSFVKMLTNRLLTPAANNEGT